MRQTGEERWEQVTTREALGQVAELIHPLTFDDDDNNLKAEVIFACARAMYKLASNMSQNVDKKEGANV